MARILTVFLLMFTLAGCGSLGGQRAIDFDTNAEGTAEELMERARSLRERRQYKRSAEMYTEVERQHPLSPLAVQAQFERGMVFYEGQLYPDAVAAFDRFLGFNPGHELEPKAVLTRALCFYEQIPDVYRDQGVTRQAKVAMEDLVERFPDSSEAANAKAKLVLIDDQLAGHEMVVGRTYQRQGQFLAAQNRFKEVIHEYPTTGQVPEAFYRLVETSLSLGLVGEARGYGATLGYNFPSNIWYHRAYDLLTNL